MVGTVAIPVKTGEVKFGIITNECFGKPGLVVTFWVDYYCAMSTVSEIQAALPRLTAEELRAVDAALRRQFRDRKLGILYDDSYGLWTEDEQVSSAAEAFALMDREEKSHEPPTAG